MDEQQAKNPVMDYLRQIRAGQDRVECKLDKLAYQVSRLEFQIVGLRNDIALRGDVRVENTRFDTLDDCCERIERRLDRVISSLNRAISLVSTDVELFSVHHDSGLEHQWKATENTMDKQPHTNPVIERLRQIQAGQGRIERKMDDLPRRINRLEFGVASLCSNIVFSEARSAEINAQLDRLSARLDRIERRVDL